MKKYLLLLITLFTFSLTTVQAQNEQGNTKKGFDREAFVKDRADFFIKALELSDAETKEFIPLLNEFMEKKFEINRDARKTRSKIKTSKTDATYKAALDALLDAKIKEAEVQKEYYLKFEKILPVQKVFKMSKVEIDFMHKIVEDHQKRHRGNKK